VHEKPHVDPPPGVVRARRQPGQKLDGLLDPLHRRRDRASAKGRRPRLPEGVHGPVPDLRADGVVRPGFGLLGPSSPGMPLDRGEDDAVERPAPLEEQRGVGHVVGEGMLEGVREIGEQAALVEELRRLEMLESPPEGIGGEPGDLLE
jgi:hypothetical protein